MSDLICSLPDEPMQAPVVERRAWVRRSCHLESEGRSVAHMREIHWFGTVTELSPGGVRLLLNRRFEVGSILEIEIPLARLSADTLTARVVHLLPRETGEWIVGCAFERPLARADLDALLSEGAAE